MSDKVNVDLGPVQRTMFLPLWGRASETRSRIKIIGTEKYFCGRWLHLKPRYWLMSFLSDVMKIQYIVHIRFGSRQ